MLPEDNNLCICLKKGLARQILYKYNQFFPTVQAGFSFALSYDNMGLLLVYHHHSLTFI